MCDNDGIDSKDKNKNGENITLVWNYKKERTWEQLFET